MGMTLHLNEKRLDEKMTDKVNSEKSSKKVKNKPKRDWVGIIHRDCRVCIFRVLEAVFAVLVVTILALVVGSMFLPGISFSMATTAGITQSTDIYTAIALWLIPMLFFTLLITAASFCILRKFLRWLHAFYSNAIRKGNEKDKERATMKGGDKK